VDATGAEVTRTYQSAGVVQITLTVIDDDGSETQAQIELTVQPEQTTTPSETETTTPGGTETTTPKDTETTTPGGTETTVPGGTESEVTTSPQTSTDTTQTPGDTETQGPGQPGFGIGAAIAGLGGAGYMLKRRLNSTDDEQ
jgi:PGF-CTERM protein